MSPVASDSNCPRFLPFKAGVTKLSLSLTERALLFCCLAVTPPHPSWLLPPGQVCDKDYVHMYRSGFVSSVSRLCRVELHKYYRQGNRYMGCAPTNLRRGEEQASTGSLTPTSELRMATHSRQTQSVCNDQNGVTSRFGGFFKNDIWNISGSSCFHPSLTYRRPASPTPTSKLIKVVEAQFPRV